MEADISHNKKEQLEEALNLVRNNPSHRNYWFVHKKIQSMEINQGDFPNTKNVKIALLSSHTIDLLETYLEIDCFLSGLHPEVYVGPFNQYRQAIMDKNSKLYRMDPDLIIFAIHLESLLPARFSEEFPRLDLDEIENELNAIFKNLTDTISILQQRTDAIIVFSNFIVPTFTPFGILESKQEMGYRTFYSRLNQRLEEFFRDSGQVYIFDLDGQTSSFGKDRMTNMSMYYRGTILFSEEFLPVLSHGYMSYVKALRNLTRKAIVLDLDNTLWGGIIGEDGMDGIKLSNTYPGKEFVDFQKLLLTYYHRGIILAINSKNNFDDAMEVIRDHPAMVLREDHFAAMRINWQDKVQNLLELADELNIGLDSLVFVDDNPVERLRVKQSLPQVLVVDLPEQPTQYRTTLKQLNDFNTFSLTPEDMKRGEMYVARRKRKDLQSDLESMENFIESLEVEAHINLATEFALPRVTSLINRTNQFNLTTRRFTENQVKDFWKNNDGMDVYTLRVQDRFGDEGIVGVAMVEKEEKVWKIVNFMMSCRIIGRKIETVFLYKILNDAYNTGVTKVEGEYLPTKKNSLVANFYPDHGFEEIESSEDGTRYQRKLTETLSYPVFIEVVTDGP